MENDLDAAMYGVMDPDYKCEMLVMSGTGIGMAIAMNGKQFKGGSGFAGELGYCQIWNGTRKVELEELCAGYMLASMDEVSQEDMFYAGWMLGMAVSWAVNILNPNRITLAGGMMKNELYSAGCVQGIKEFASKDLIVSCFIQIAESLDEIVCNGLLQKLRYNGNEYREKI